MRPSGICHKERPFVMTQGYTGKDHNKIQHIEKMFLQHQHCIKYYEELKACVLIPVAGGLTSSWGHRTRSHKQQHCRPWWVRLETAHKAGEGQSLWTEMEEATSDGESSAGPWRTDCKKQSETASNPVRPETERAGKRRCEYLTFLFQKSYRVKAWRSNLPKWAH